MVAAAEDIDWTTLIYRDDFILVGQLVAEPQSLLRSFCQSQLPEGVRLYPGIHMSGILERLSGVPLVSYGAMFSNANLVRNGSMEIFPVHYSRLPMAVANGLFQPQVVLIQVARDDATNDLYWAGVQDYMLEACRAARLVIAECNSLAPVVQGARIPNEVRIDWMVETSTALPTVESPIATDVERRIAAHVSNLIENGSTIQAGIGNLSNTILYGLAEHRHLGVHSGIISDGVKELMECGVIDNECKSSYRGVTVTGLLAGSAELYEFVHKNPYIKLCTVSETHARAKLGALKKPVAINSGLQVDLIGQVNAEHVRGRYLGGLGGLADFARGISMAPHGKSLICLPSTLSKRDDHGESMSRIVARLEGPATLGCADADTVVTEWGVARLRHLSLRQRIKAMIRIAHPNHRDRLRDQAADWGV